MNQDYLNDLENIVSLNLAKICSECPNRDMCVKQNCLTHQEEERVVVKSLWVEKEKSTRVGGKWLGVNETVTT